MIAVDPWVIGAAIVVFVALSLAIRRRPGPADRALDDATSFAAKAELNANMERTRNVPPPP